MRLLMCLECRSLEELPDYSGPSEGDVLLEELAGRHEFAPGYPHHGNLIAIKDEDWANEKWRKDVIKQLWSDAGHTGLEPEFYETKNTFQDEAMKCFSAHMRPQNGCIDWKDKAKRLGNSMLDDDDRAVAKEHGLKRKRAVYLCDFCPAKFNYVQKQAYSAAGLYDN